MMNVVVLKGLVSIINEFSAEMRKIESTGVSRADLMSTLKVLGADMSYLMGHAPATSVASATPAAAPAVGKSVVNASVPTKAVKPVAPQQRAQAPKAAVKAAPQPAPATPVAPVPAGKKLTIYTDGSFKDGTYGWAFAVYDGDKLIHSDKGGGNEPELVKTRNIAGELKAAMAAMAWAKKTLERGDRVIIAYDYAGVANWVLGIWKAKTELAQMYVEYMGQFKGCLSFRKVAGHSGVEGNELVDKLAKEAVEAVLSEPAAEETIPVPQEEAPAPVEEPVVTPAVETTPVTPVEEEKTANKEMTTEEFNSQEPDPELQRFQDEMAKIQFDAINSSEDF